MDTPQPASSAGVHGVTEGECDQLACDYAMGLLDAAAMEVCTARLHDDTLFAASVEAWRRRLGELDVTAPEIALEPSLWTRIESSLGAPKVATRKTSQQRMGERLAAGWSSVVWWRSFGLAAAAASLLLAIGLGYIAQRAAQAPVLVAVLLSDERHPAGLVNVFRDGRTDFVALQAIRAPEGKSLQLWTLWDRARGPVSVGLMQELHNAALRLDGLPGTTADQLFEVTLEPEGGSPTGRPTGPILMKGNAGRTEGGA